MTRRAKCTRQPPHYVTLTVAVSSAEVDGCSNYLDMSVLQTVVPLPDVVAKQPAVAAAAAAAADDDDNGDETAESTASPTGTLTTGASR